MFDSAPIAKVKPAHRGPQTSSQLSYTPCLSTTETQRPQNSQGNKRVQNQKTGSWQPQPTRMCHMTGATDSSFSEQNNLGLSLPAAQWAELQPNGRAPWASFVRAGSQCQPHGPTLRRAHGAHCLAGTVSKFLIISSLDLIFYKCNMLAGRKTLVNRDVIFITLISYFSMFHSIFPFPGNRRAHVSILY